MLDDRAYEEWIASYWAKDLSELFVVDKKTAFTRLVELLFMHSGGLLDSQRLATACGVSRPTVQHWLSILETTLLATTLRPFHGGAAAEIRSQPKVYAFDTGFVAYFRGWETLRDEDRGALLEHLVLGEIAARFGISRLHYWRDKAGHEVAFVLEIGRRRELVAIECKSSAASLDPAALAALRRRHPRGRNLCVTLRSTEAFTRRFGAIEVEHVPYLALPAWLDALR